MTDDSTTRLTMAEVNAYVLKHGEDPNIISTNAKGKALWDALTPLVAQGSISENEQLMLLVCLTYGKYPVTGHDFLHRSGIRRRR